MSARPPKLIYFDLNHWISLAKALSGHRDSEAHKEILAACLSAADNRTAVFPISASIYIEISKIRNYRQRCDLRAVIEQVSRYMVVTSRFVIATHEIEGLLDRLVGLNSQPINTMDYLDWGVFRAFGMVGGLGIKSISGQDVTDEYRHQYADGPQAFDSLVSKATLDLNRQVIDGPSQDEESDLRKLGWNPQPLLKMYEQKAEDELEQVRRFNCDPQWRRDRIRDAISAREVLLEINTILKRGCDDRGVDSLEKILPEIETTRCAFDSMPSFDVAVTLKTSYHRDAMHLWTQNDIHDINALASTIPYCDIVVTDKAMASHAIRTGLAERLNTIVLARLSDLPKYL